MLKWQSTRGRRNEQAILARQRDASVPEKATPSLLFGFSFEDYRLEAEGVVKGLCRLIFSWPLTIFSFITKQALFFFSRCRRELAGKVIGRETQ